MKDFFFQNWEMIATLTGVVFFGSFKVTRLTLKKIILAGVNAFLTEDMIKAIILKGLEKYVKSTKTDLDDKWLCNLKKELAK